jgi:hypothetical protein
MRIEPNLCSALLSECKLTSEFEIHDKRITAGLMFTVKANDACPVAYASTIGPTQPLVRGRRRFERFRTARGLFKERRDW